MVLNFATFQIDFDRRQLFRDGKNVHLSPKALQLLQVLIEARPKAVGKAEIHDHLWRGTFVSDSNLASLVNELRRGLDDDAHAPAYIRTVHAFGYAFCAEPVESVPMKPGAAAIARLVWDKGEKPLFSGRNVIGRDSDAAVQVEDRTISRHHAQIVVGPQGATVEDLESKNGTFLNGVRVAAPVPIGDGSVLEVGSVRMLYQEISGLSTTTLYRQ
jgi:DNA-binding winged helix-turn-helix (wHTH) protein